MKAFKKSQNSNQLHLFIFNFSFICFTIFKCNTSMAIHICTPASRMAGHLQCNLWPTSVAQLKSFRGQLNFVSSIKISGHMRTIPQSEQIERSEGRAHWSPKMAVECSSSPSPGHCVLPWTFPWPNPLPLSLLFRFF